MSIKVRLENAKKDFDWQDVVDLIDEVGREIDRKDKTIAELDESLQQWILLYDIAQKKAKELALENEKLKIKIEVMERG